MKILIIGYGSMGRRRIRLLKELVTHAEFICVDCNSERLMQARNAGIYAFSDLKTAYEEKPDLAFVCTPPGNHEEIILSLIEEKIHVFTEINLFVQGYDIMMKKAEEKNVVVFLSSTMLYDKQIRQIGELVRDIDKPLTYIYHVGQYLPDWHPWENYKNFFIGKKETNGVREILAIQLPWVIDVFGKVKDLSAHCQKCTGLDIDFYDSVVINFKHESGSIGVFVADVVSRKATTSLEIIGESLHLFWNGQNNGLFVYDFDDKKLRNIPGYDTAVHIDGYADTIIENQYRDEVQNFLDVVYGNAKSRYSLGKDKYILSIIDQIEELE